MSTLTWTPSAIGEQTVTITATDARGAVGTASAVVNVAVAPDAPTSNQPIPDKP